MNRFQTVSTAFLLSVSVAAMGQSQNLITNPSFTNGGSGWVLWTDASATQAASSVTYPDSGGRDGGRYARVEVTSPAEENWHIQFQTPAGWNAVFGATYEMTFWAKSDSFSNVHFSVQDGPNNGFMYRTGFDFGFTPDWAEYSFSYMSDVEGTGALRFFLYLGATVDTYGFDDFNLVEHPPAGINIRAASEGRQTLQVLRGTDNFILLLNGGATGNWKAELFDARGASLASTSGRADGSLRLPQPKTSGTYFVRASTPTRSWVQRVSIP